MAGAVICVGTMPKRRSKRETIAFKDTGSVCAKLESSGCIAAILEMMEVDVQRGSKIKIDQEINHDSHSSRIRTPPAASPKTTLPMASS